MSVKYADKLKKDTRITILALSWRDLKSPTAGGAEVHTHEMLKRIDKKKYRVIHLAASYERLPESEIIDGVQYIRKGNIFSVIGYACIYYKSNKKNIDYVIEQCNTHRFFTPLWIKSSRRIFYIHQLTREIWDINMRFPLNKLGKWTESMCLKLNKNDHVITVSESTKSELIELGYSSKKITIIPNGIAFRPWSKDQWYAKEKIPTFVYVGRYMGYKGIDAAVESIGMLKKEGIEARLWLLGKRDIQYIEEKLLPICRQYEIVMGKDNISSDVISWGFVEEEKKRELLSRATALVFPSVREGWGIPITEAGVVGTPSIVYNAPGIRDAVNCGKAGYLCKKNSPDGLKEIMRFVIQDKEYENRRAQAYEFSNDFQWDNNSKKIELFFENLKKNKEN